MNSYQVAEIQEHIEMYWKKIKEIADAKDASKIDELRLNVRLLKQYLVRKYDHLQCQAD